MKSKVILLVPFAVLALSGCSATRMAVRATSDAVYKGMPAITGEDDLQTAWETMLPNLKLLEVLLADDPENSRLREMLAQGYCSYAFMFLDGNKERAKKFYDRGAGYARGSLDRYFKGEEFASASVSGGDVPRLFWHAFCRASYIKLDASNPESIAALPGVEKEADAVLAADPGYYYNSPYALKGALLSARPKMFGGRPEEARKYFEKAVSGPGAGFALNRLMFAQSYGVAAQDREFFETELKKITDTDFPKNEIRLPNEAAKEKAKLLLEKTDELF